MCKNFNNSYYRVDECLMGTFNNQFVGASELSWVSCARSAVSEMWFINQRWVSGGGAANYDDTSRRRCFPRWWLPHFYDAITLKRNECFETSGLEYLCLNGRKCLFAEQLEQWAISGGEFESKLLRNDSDQLAFNGNRLTEWCRGLLRVCGSLWRLWV